MTFHLVDNVTPVTLGEGLEQLSPTQVELLAEGETLPGKGSLTGISIQKIAEAAGQANKYAFQYYFGGLDGLVDAIFAARTQKVADRRRALFDKVMKERVGDDIEALIPCIYLPQAEQVNAAGRHSYMRFVTQYFMRDKIDPAHDVRSSPKG